MINLLQSFAAAFLGGDFILNGPLDAFSNIFH